MPIMWRYLLRDYLRILTLSIVAFISILLVTRLTNIASFASSGASVFDIARFALYQLPYLLPIALPISCLISSIILFQKLSSTHELTALRSAGIGLHSIIAPLLIAGGLLSIFNFYISSEVATYCHMSTRKMYNEISSANPLTLMQNKNLLKLKGLHVDIGSQKKDFSYAENIIIIYRNDSESRINLMTTEKIEVSEDELDGYNMSIISNASNTKKNIANKNGGNIMIENIAHFKNPSKDIPKLINKPGWKLDNDHLKLRLLLAKATSLKKLLNSTQDNINVKTEIFSIYSEITRRISISIATLTFTLIGATFGINIKRNPSKKGTLFVVGLATFFLATFFIGKGMKNNFYTASMLFIIPHIILTYFSVKTIKNVNRGIE